LIGVMGVLCCSQEIDVEGEGSMAARNLEQEFDGLRGDIDKLRGDLASLTKSLGEVARETAGAGARRARAAADDIAHRLDAATVDARLKARENVARVEQQIEERPFTAVAIAFGIGLLMGRLMSR
jgi:ElaB/YqjD/DUF883 family membrane-anchored ribosome-binding protein